MKTSTSTSPRQSRLTEYVRLLLKLHEFELAGRADSEEADAVRDAMDEPWRYLTAKEIELSRGLSSDLYSLVAQPNEVSVVRKDIEGSIRAAAERDEYGKALSILRENAAILPTTFIAHWRGNCWADLRQFDVAILFYQEAKRLQPSNDFHDYMLLHAFLSAQRHDGALEAATTIASRDNTSPPLLWMASMIMFRCATERASAVNNELLHSAIRGVERANSSNDPVFLSVFKRDAVAANTLRGLAYDQLDQPKMALEACELVLRLEPSDRTARYLRALLTRTSNPAASKEDTAFSLGFAPSSATDSHRESKFSTFETFQPALAS